MYAIKTLIQVYMGLIHESWKRVTPTVSRGTINYYVVSLIWNGAQN